MTLHIDGEDYLIRSHFGDSVDHQHSHNTYMEVFIMKNPLKPRIIKLIDRSFLHQDKLAITDFKVYNRQIFLLDFHNGFSVFGLTPAQHLVTEFRYRTDSGYLRMGVFSGNLGN